MSENTDLKRVARRESRFATLAKEEGKGNAKLAKKATGANKKDLQWEADVDKGFAGLRTKRAAAAKRKIK